MTSLGQLSLDYQRIELAIRYLNDNALQQPNLTEVAAQIGLSEFHFQRLFTRWAGISPKRFLQFLTIKNAKALLNRSSVLSAAYEAGLSGSSRLHDLFVQCEAVTPGEFRKKGAGLDISYGFHPTPFGECLLALTGLGICFLGFVQGDQHLRLLDELRLEWANANLLEDPPHTLRVVEQIFTPRLETPIPLHLRGTNFQIKVWEALVRLPPGAVTSYETLAGQVGSSNAARAVGNAVAHNPVAYLIPCHRVIQKAGGLGNYRYGHARKQAILLWENARSLE
jgi:AraC family transcriptional regulator of adaptative response/methylated-DNA-[protein]-cysteine methyltransferase